MAVKIFCSYADKDEELLEELKEHLRPLISSGLIEWWHDRNISVGTEWQYEVDSHLNKAEIILLLTSQYFMDSDYAYTLEAARALERHEHGEARVIPILLRPIYYGRAPFAKLQALPTDALPVISWRNRDEAFAKIAKDLQISLQEGLEPLTQRELHILRLLDKGLTNKEIARELVVTPGTVKVHTNNLYRKLSVNNRRAAVTLAKALGLLVASGK
jgi:DNA-binding CsgD family transcriptional regulator